MSAPVTKTFTILPEPNGRRQASPLGVVGEAGGDGTGTAVTNRVERAVSLQTVAYGGGLLPRIGNAFKAFSAALFSPVAPMAPPEVSQAEGARTFQYTSGYNVNYTPRAAEGLTPFSWMLNIASLFDTLNMSILYRQEELSALDWEIVPRNPRKPPSDAQLSEARERLEKPDGETRFGQWISSLLWEALVTDAVSIFVNKSLTGDVLSFDAVDGSTIKPLVGGNGRVPTIESGAPAYQQVMYGRPIWEGTKADLIYAPKNRRPRSAYGNSPTEMLILTTNRALRRQGHDINYYTAGNIPDALVAAPAEWSQTQIENYQGWFDTVVAQPTNRRKLWFLPTQNGRLNVFQFRPPVLDTDVERFLDQRVFAMIGVSPQALGFMNDVNRSQGAMQENTEFRRRLPFLRFFGGVIMDMLDLANLPDCMIQFAGEKPDEDKVAQAKADDIYLRNGTISTEDIHQRQGIKPLGQRYVYTMSGPVAFPLTLEQITAQQEPEAAPSAENADVQAEPPENVSTTKVTANENADVEVERRARRTDAPLSEQLAELAQWQRYVKQHPELPLKRQFVTRALAPDVSEAVRVTLQLRAQKPKEDEQRWIAATFDEARALVVEANKEKAAV